MARCHRLAHQAMMPVTRGAARRSNHIYKPHADNHLVPRRRYRRPRPGGMTPREASVGSTAMNRWLLALHRPDDPRPDGCRRPDPGRRRPVPSGAATPATRPLSSAVDDAAACGVSCRLLVLPADLRARMEDFQGAIRRGPGFASPKANPTLTRCRCRSSKPGWTMHPAAVKAFRGRESAGARALA